MTEGVYPKIDGDILYASEVNASPPIGTVMSWLKSLTGTPSLPSNWVECNGQLISDVNSPYNGVTLPNLNGTQTFLRGNSTSGATGGSTTHTHTGPSHDHTWSDTVNISISGSTNTTGSHTHSVSGTTSTYNDTAYLNSIGGGSGTIYATDDHSHTWSDTSSSDGSHSHTFSDSDSDSIGGTTSASGTGATGSAGTLPTYYEVVWIIKIK
jgi:hypothetical protein